MIKSEFCKNCPINHVTEGYVPPHTGNNGLVFLGEAPEEEDVRQGRHFIGGFGSWLTSVCKSSNTDLANASHVNIIGCSTPKNLFPSDPKWRATDRATAKAGVEYCKQHHMLPALEGFKTDKLFALGEYALQAVTNRKSIDTWRGSPLQMNGTGPLKVIPTYSPKFVGMNAKFFPVVKIDLGKSLVLPPENYNINPTLTDVRNFTAKKFSFDFEWDRDGNITLCGLSDRLFNAITIPFEGDFIPLLKRIFENATEIIGHNIISADMAYFSRLGWNVDHVKISDTMLKQHIVQPDYKHGLGFVGSVFTNKVFWKGKGKETEDESGHAVPANVQWLTWDKPWAIPRALGGYGGCGSADEAYALYNARDTDGEFQINIPLDEKLKKYGMEGVYENVSVPVAFICRDMSDHGFRIDTSRLGVVRDGLNKDIEALEGELPTGLKPYFKEVSCNLPAPAGTFKTKIKKCKGSKKLGTQHDVEEIIFTDCNLRSCTVCGATIDPGKMVASKTIKGTKQVRVVPYNSNVQLQEYTKKLKLHDVYDSKTQNITTGKKARSSWSKAGAKEFITLGLLKDKITLRNNFAKDKLLGQSRMYFNIRVHGTGEARLSSIGQRKGIDLNIQNQPKEFRAIYIPDYPTWGILDLDIVQGENMLTTWLAKDWDRWERINTPGYDEHSDMASSMFNENITKEMTGEKFWHSLHPKWTIEQCKAKALYYDKLRGIGKKINHGRNYGMGARKQREELLTLGYDVTEADVKEAIEIWKKKNARTALWQEETIATVAKQGYLCNVFGRRRWFQSRDYATKSLAYLPASTLAEMVIRMMIAHYPNHPRCKGPLQALGLPVVIELAKDWIMETQVHDSLVLQGPDELYLEQAARSHAIMTQSWKELNGFKFNSEAKYSMRSWDMDRDGRKVKIATG